jgi:lipoic acid synthetase
MIIKETHCSLLQIRDCGETSFRETLELQRRLVEQRKRGEIGDTILIVEHRPVITLGVRQNANNLLAEREKLAEKGIDLVEIRRGGGATAHNPGQIVIYPILNLQELHLGVSEYIRMLEQIGIELLTMLGVKSQRRKGFPGLWMVRQSSPRVENRKIASIGVRVSRQITYHGMAININNDLSIFDYIVPCGLEGVEMTSVLRETGELHQISESKEKLKLLLYKYFQKTDDGGRKTEERGQDARDTKENRRLPSWLKRPMAECGEYNKTSELVNTLGLETICMSANCPNRGKCWSRGTATVLILGKICMRGCKFCSVAKGRPGPLDATEPGRVAELAKRMNLHYLVITSVNRDDLADGGAGHFRDCIGEVRRQCPEIKFEILTPDFKDCQEKAIKILAEVQPFVFAHNVETVPGLYKKARSGGDYQLSLNLLRIAKEAFGDVPTKSSIMLGLGESDEEVEQVLRDLRAVGCERLTIGQYLKPSKDSLEVVEYIRPEKFDWWRKQAIDLGFNWVISAPFARSSYLADTLTGTDVNTD